MYVILRNTIRWSALCVCIASHAHADFLGSLTNAVNQVQQTVNSTAQTVNGAQQTVNGAQQTVNSVQNVVPPAPQTTPVVAANIPLTTDELNARMVARRNAINQREEQLLASIADEGRRKQVSMNVAGLLHQAAVEEDKINQKYRSTGFVGSDYRAEFYTTSVRIYDQVDAYLNDVQAGKI